MRRVAKVQGGFTMFLERGMEMVEKGANTCRLVEEGDEQSGIGGTSFSEAYKRERCSK